jgi:hypothetical protein
VSAHTNVFASAGLQRLWMRKVEEMLTEAMKSSSEMAQYAELRPNSDDDKQRQMVCSI